MNYEKELHDLFLMQQTYGTMFSLTNKLQVVGDKYMTGLTSRQYMTVVAILHLPEDETTINNIASKLGTSKQNANRMVSSIEKLGYLKSFPSEKDKRAINVKLTESGKKKIKECAEQSINFIADAFHDFSTEELETLWGLLKKLYCFDDELQDGFEEIGRDIADVPDFDSESNQTILEGFSRRRNRK